MSKYDSLWKHVQQDGKNPLSLRLRKYRILPEYQSTTLVTYPSSKII